MTTIRDYIPRPDEQCNGWANNFYHVVTNTTTVWNITDTEIINHLINFRHEDTGKKVYCYCCWVNHHEEEGPLTAMMMAMVRV